MRDFRLDPEDLENLPLAYDWLIAQPGADPARSGLLGTCVGGSFALMSAASPLIRDRVGFVAAYAPYSSIRTFARDIASGTTSSNGERKPWAVDQLTRKVFVHSVTATLEPGEAEQIRSAFDTEAGTLDDPGLSAEGQAIVSLLTAADADAAELVLSRLPIHLQDRLAALSPIHYVADIRAPLIVLLHDHGDQVIPVGESHRLLSALAGREGVHYTEMQFQHLDPTKGHLPWFRLLREFSKFFRALLPVVRQAVA
jgi:dipeptidyl aminopeptidase/acylaminoacyl peptidase